MTRSRQFSYDVQQHIIQRDRNQLAFPRNVRIETASTESYRLKESELLTFAFLAIFSAAAIIVGYGNSLIHTISTLF